MCRGFRQFKHRDLIESFAAEFFERIEVFVDSAPYSIAHYIYMFL